MRIITLSNMQYIVQSAHEANAAGTSFIHEIDIAYDELIRILGKPTHAQGDSHKVDIEWVITRGPDVFTIYNYKDGKNYLGDEGLENEDIRDWHIGTNITTHALDFIRDLQRELEQGGDKE